MTQMLLPSGWTYDRLKFVARLKYGDSLAADARSPGDIEVFGSNGSVGTHDVANTHGPVILVGRKGSYGKLQHSNKPVFAIDTTFFIDRLSSDAHLKWLFYALQTLGLHYFSQDTGVPGLSREIAENLNICVPPTEQRQTIARFLDYRTAQLDALIEKFGGRFEQTTFGKKTYVGLLLEYRSALITAAVTGQIDVRGWQPPEAYAAEVG